jgi:hypothetical protein
MTQRITYISEESMLKRLQRPFILLFAGFTLIVLTVNTSKVSTLMFLLWKPMILVAVPVLILVGLWGVISALISPFLDLPRLTLSIEGLKLEQFLSTRFFAWNELGPFELQPGRDLWAKIIGGKYKRKGKLIIPPLEVDKMDLFRELSEWQENAAPSRKSEYPSEANTI